jgi:hypothetical protein
MMMILSMPRRLGGMLLLALVFETLFLGCGKPTGEVSGTVTYKDKSLTEGTVTFTPEQGNAIFAEINSEGKYLAKKVPLGKAKVSVRGGAMTSTETLKGVQNAKSPEEMKKAMMPQVQKGKPSVPKEYSDPDKSGLTHTVTAGPQEYNIPLK